MDIMVQRIAVESWELAGNSGWSSVQGHLRGVFVREGEAYLLARIVVRAKNWIAPDGLDRGELADDACVVLSQAEIPRRHLGAACRAFMDWLNSPQDTETVWVDERGQYFALSLAPRKEFISSQEKPVCEVVFRMHQMRGEHRFIVDQSCVRLFVQGLDSWLRATRGFAQAVE